MKFITSSSSIAVLCDIPRTINRNYSRHTSLITISRASPIFLVNFNKLRDRCAMRDTKQNNNARYITGELQNNSSTQPPPLCLLLYTRECADERNKDEDQVRGLDLGARRARARVSPIFFFSSTLQAMARHNREEKRRRDTARLGLGVDIGERGRRGGRIFFVRQRTGTRARARARAGRGAEAAACIMYERRESPSFQAAQPFSFCDIDLVVSQ